MRHFGYSWLNVRFSRALCIIAVAPFFVVPAAGYKLRPFSIFGSDVPIPFAFHGKVYYLPEGTTHMPVFTTMKPIGDVYATTLNVPTQDYEEGFPGVRSRVEFFGIDYDGYFWITEPGEYRFSLASDDGSLLFIDDRVIVNNDGEHFTQEMRGKMMLSRGSHHIRVEYFQSVRYAVALILQIAPPDEPFRLFDMRDYRRPLEVDSNPLAPGGMYLDTLSPAARAAFDALMTEPLAHDLEYGVRAIRFPSAGEYSQYVVSVEIPASSLTAKKQRLHAHFLAIIRDSHGAVVQRISKAISADVSRLSQTPLLNYEGTVRLAPGFYAIETAVVDWLGGRAGARIEYIYNLRRHGVALSGVALIQQLEDMKSEDGSAGPLQTQGKRLVPLLNTTLSRAAAPYIYFVVYPDKDCAFPPRLHIQLARDGEVMDTQTSSLPPVDAAGGIPMLIGTSRESGNYDVQIGVS